MTYESIFIKVSCGTFEEAEKIGKELIEKKWAGTVKIYKDAHLMYPSEKGAEGEAVFHMEIKTTKRFLKDINVYILENHSWGTPCVEVVPIVNDFC